MQFKSVTEKAGYYRQKKKDTKYNLTKPYKRNPKITVTRSMTEKSPLSESSARVKKHRKYKRKKNECEKANIRNS